MALILNTDGSFMYVHDSSLAAEDSFTYAVSDGVSSSAPATVTISFSGSPPVALADTRVYGRVGSVVTLDGSDSYDPDGELIGYAWTFESTSTHSLLADSDILGASTPNPTFVPDAPCRFVVRLIVTAGSVASEPVFVKVSAGGGENVHPRSKPGRDITALVGAGLFVDGGGSYDVGGAPRPLSYEWKFEDLPLGSLLEDRDLLDATMPRARFVPDVSGAYRIVLEIDDGDAQDSEQVVVSASTSAEGVRPNSFAGADMLAFLGDYVRLDGSRP